MPSPSRRNGLRGVCDCSVECQRKHWKEHKPTCDYFEAERARMGEEPIVQRNLRHRITRYGPTLATACVRGLRLKSVWERIGQAALV
ncbi:hypothetical protein B0H19DRAFT_1184044, partial [Mycena capillaripes]